jgi:copper homeostasis protein
MRVLELCVDSVASALTAEAGGADRIELCAALSEGGLTPSLGLLRNVRSKLNVPVHVMIRPRTGDFIYSDDDFAIMQEDIALAAQSGADGVVFGLLTSDGEIDIERTSDLVRLSKPMQVTFHRAMDLTPDPVRAIEAIIQSGADRVLTSGGELNAMLGRVRIQRLVRAARGRIHVMVGGGIRSENLAELVQVTGAKEWHTSLRRPGIRQDEHAPSANLLAEQLGWEQSAPPFHSEDVKRLRQILDTADELEPSES